LPEPVPGMNQFVASSPIFLRDTLWREMHPETKARHVIDKKPAASGWPLQDYVSEAAHTGLLCASFLDLLKCTLDVN